MHEMRKAFLENEYKKTGINPNDIQMLKTWLENQPHLPKEIDELDLILAYECSDHSFEVAKQRLDTNFTYRTLFNNIFKDRAVNKSIIKALSSFVCYKLETLSYDKTPVILIQLIKTDVESFNFTDMAKAAFMVFDLMQYESGTQNGYIVIVNCKGGTFQHLANFDIRTFQQISCFLKDAILAKLKEVHFINAQSFAKHMYNTLRPITPEQFLNIIFFHEKGSNTIKDVVPLEGFPKECGGEGKTLKEISDETIEKLLANTDFFEKEGMKRVNEELRRGKPKKLDDVFGGIEGSFKKLDID